MGLGVGGWGGGRRPVMFPTLVGRVSWILDASVGGAIGTGS